MKRTSIKLWIAGALALAIWAALFAPRLTGVENAEALAPLVILTFTFGLGATVIGVVSWLSGD